MKVKVSLFVLFFPELDFFRSYGNSCLFAQPVIDENIWVIEGVEPDGIIASAGHSEECCGDCGTSGLAFRAADIKIGHFVREPANELDYRHGMRGLESTDNTRIFDIVECDIKFVALIVLEIFVFPVGADYDRISFLGQVKWKLEKLWVKSRYGKYVECVFLHFCVHFLPFVIMP